MLRIPKTDCASPVLDALTTGVQFNVNVNIFRAKTVRYNRIKERQTLGKISLDSEVEVNAESFYILEGTKKKWFGL